jgi:hypothetical protein
VDALEKAFSRSSADVLGWLNADDLLEPGALESVMRAFARAPDVDIVSGTCLLVDEAGVPYGAMRPPDTIDAITLLRRVSGLPQPSTFFRRSAWQRVGGLPREYRLVFDTEFFRRVVRTGTAVAIPDVLARFRVRAGSLSGRAPAQAAREDLHARRKLGLAPWTWASFVLATRGYAYPWLPESLLSGARAMKRAALRRTRRVR